MSGYTGPQIGGGTDAEGSYTKSTTYPGMLDYFEPSEPHETHTIGRLLNPEELPPFAALLEHVGTIALKEGLEAHITGRAEDMYVSTSRLEQHQAAGRILGDALPTTLEMILAERPFTEQEATMPAGYQGMRLLLGKKPETRLVVRVESRLLRKNKGELADILGSISGVPQFDPNGGSPYANITIARFRSPIRAAVHSQLFDTSSIDDFPHRGQRISVGHIQVVDLTAMQHRIIRPDPDFAAG